MAANKKSPGLLLRNAGIFNPVLVQAVGLCPVVAMATTLRGAALLAGIAAVIITLSELIASLFFKAIPRWVRIGLYIIIGGALIAPFMLWFEKADAELFGSLGIYLPIMAVNSLIVLRCERFAVKISPVSALLDGLTASAGYAAVLVFIGAVREVIGSGSIGGFRFWERRTFPGMLLPFGGFIIIGFSAAILRAFISVYWPKYLDKKQPKPKDKRHPAQKRPRPAAAVASAPDLTPDDSPFSLAEISAFGDEPSDDASDTSAQGSQAEAAEEIAPVPTECEAEPTTAEEPEKEEAEVIAEQPAEIAIEQPAEIETEPPAAQAAAPSDGFRDLSLDEVLTDSTPAPAQAKAETADELIDDDELEVLMSRSTEEVIAAVKATETESKADSDDDEEDKAKEADEE